MVKPNSNKRVDVADVFSSVADQLRRDRDRLNDLDKPGGNANHGDNMVANFDLIAEELRRDPSGDAGERLRRAASRLQHEGKGRSAKLYAEGLMDASQGLSGQQGLGLDDLLPLLQGLLGGVQRSTDAQPGQGTMLDSLLPGIMGFAQARGSGRSDMDAIMEGLGAAMRGSNQAYRRSSGEERQDPGAASGASVLEGIFRNFLG
jgi:dihydroxyacetone kinase-like protein